VTPEARTDGRGSGPGNDGAPGRGPFSASNEEKGPIGPFPRWKWVYGTVLLYGTLMILALWILTRVLDPGLAP
jgi:hypothetical protein